MSSRTSWVRKRLRSIFSRTSTIAQPTTLAENDQQAGDAGNGGDERRLGRLRPGPELAGLPGAQDQQGQPQKDAHDQGCMGRLPQVLEPLGSVTHGSPRMMRGSVLDCLA